MTNQCLKKEIAIRLKALVSHYKYIKGLESETIRAKQLVNIDDIRSKLRFLILNYKDEIDEFISQSHMGESYQDETGPDFSEFATINNHSKLKRIQRPELLKIISSILESSNLLVLKGLPGCGKSHLTHDYSLLMKNHEGMVSFIIESDSEQAISTAFRKIGERNLKMDLEGKGPKQIVSEIYGKLGINGTQRFLLVFENVENFKIIDSYFHPPKNIEIIVTTRHDNLLYEYPSFADVKHLKIDEFSNIEATAFLNQNISHTLPEPILQNILSFTHCIPQHLALVISYLNCTENRFKSIEDISSAYELQKTKDESPIRVAIKYAQKKNDKSLGLLIYLAWLSSQVSIQKVLSKIIQDSALFETINELERLSLISVNGKQRENQIVIISSAVQDETISYYEQEVKGQIVLEILTKFDEIIQVIQEEPDELWKTINEFSIHVIFALQKMETWKIENTKEIQSLKASLYFKIALYNLFININFERAMKDINQCLTLAEELGLEQLKVKCILLKGVINEKNHCHDYYLGYELKCNAKSLAEQNIISTSYESQILFAEIEHQIAISCMLLQDYYAVISYCNKSLLLYEKTQSKLQIANVSNLLGQAYAQLKNYPEAIKYYDQALAIRNELQKFNTHGTAEILINRANILKLLGDFTKSLQFELQALEISRKFFDEQSPRLLIIFEGLTDTYSHLKQSNQALTYLQKVLKIYKKLFSTGEHLRIANILHQIASFTQNYDEQMEYHLNGLNMIKRLKPGNHLRTCESLKMVAEQMFKKGDGLMIYQELFETTKQLLVNNNKPEDKIKILEYLHLCYQRFSILLQSFDNKKSIEYLKLAIMVSIQIKDSAEFKKNISRFQEFIPEIKNFVDIQYFNEMFQAISFNDQSVYIPKSSRTVIIKNSLNSEKVKQIKVKLQKLALDYIYQESMKGNWVKGLTGQVFWGAKDYCNPEFLKTLLVSPNDLQIAQTLCFEAINLSVLYLEKDHYLVLTKKFAQIYPEIIDFAVENYPDAFVDGAILKSLVSDQSKVKTLLGEQELIIEVDLAEAQTLLRSSHIKETTNLQKQTSLGLSNYEFQSVIKKLHIDPFKLQITKSKQDEESMRSKCSYTFEIEISEAQTDIQKIASKILQLPSVDWDHSIKWESTQQMGIQKLIIKCKIDEQQISVSQITDRIENLSEAIVSVIVKTQLITPKAVSSIGNPMC